MKKTEVICVIAYSFLRNLMRPRVAATREATRRVVESRVREATSAASAVQKPKRCRRGAFEQVSYTRASSEGRDRTVRDGCAPALAPPRSERTAHGARDCSPWGLCGCRRPRPGALHRSGEDADARSSKDRERAFACTSSGSVRTPEPERGEGRRGPQARRVSAPTHGPDARPARDRRISPHLGWQAMCSDGEIATAAVRSTQ